MDLLSTFSNDDNDDYDKNDDDGIINCNFSNEDDDDGLLELELL